MPTLKLNSISTLSPESKVTDCSLITDHFVSALSTTFSPRCLTPKLGPSSWVTHQGSPAQAAPARPCRTRTPPGPPPYSSSMADDEYDPDALDEDQTQEDDGRVVSRGVYVEAARLA